jgi:hypothetical protein
MVIQTANLFNQFRASNYFEYFTGGDVSMNPIIFTLLNLFPFRCMRIDEGTGVSTEVADVYCDPVLQPPDDNACHVACPGSCVLGPWSDWSDCPQVCIMVILFSYSL